MRLSTFFLLFGFSNLFISLLTLSSNSFAQDGSGRQYNDDYILHEANFNFSSGKSSNSDYDLGFTAGQTAPGEYSGDNYTVKAGFQYYDTKIPFRFSISNQFVDFGPLVPGNPIERTTNLTVSNGSAFGYQVLSYENHPLRENATGHDIPDTTCDGGTCSEITPSEWLQSTTYGLGYRCDNINGTECPSGFDPGYFKQFPNLEANESPQSVMEGENVGRELETQITYKVNVSSTQTSGLYQNQVVYIATPSI